MDLHIALKEVLKNNGTELIKSTKLINFLADMACFNEFRSASKALKEIVEQYGDELYKIKINNLPHTIVFLQNKKNYHNTSGIQTELVDYLFECISYALDLSNNVEESLLNLRNKEAGKDDNVKRECRLRFFSSLYHYFNMNVTCICAKPSQRDKEGNSYDGYYHPFKEPSDKEWTKYTNLSQDSKYLNNQNWDEASGIGAVLGYKNLRALDFDDLAPMHENRRWEEWRYPSLDNFISKALKLLGLPTDYQWVVRTGSTIGLHIIFRMDDVPDYSSNVVGFQSNTICKNNKEGFDRVELRWKGHLVLPPSKTSMYYNSGNPYYSYLYSYGFYYCNFPNYAPIKISVTDLMRFLNYFCGETDFIGYCGDARIVGNVLMTTKWNSWYGDGYCRFYMTKGWAEKIKEGEDYVNFTLCNYKNTEDELKGAIDMLKKMDTPTAHYNFASLISKGIIKDTKQEALRHYYLSCVGEVIPKELIKKLKSDIEEM